MHLPKSRRDDERGVVALAVALITCLVMMPVTALAVDIGMQRVARADMQSLADVVALDLARRLDGTTTAAQWTAKSPSLQQLADASANRNGGTIGHQPTVVAQLGTFDPVADSFTPLVSTSNVVPNAVRVAASTKVDFTFISASGGSASGSDQTGGTVRTAIAQARSTACFQLGSWAATLDPSASSLFGDMLKPLLGSSTLTAAGYNGLASARLNLLDLVQTSYIGVGTVNELLAMNDLSVADLFRASAQVLAAQGKTAQAQVFNAASTSVVAPVTINAGDLFGLTTASDAALDTDFNALDILIGAAYLANGSNALNIDNLQASLGSVGVTNTTLKIIERAQRACDHDEAKTAQATLVATAKTTVENSPLINQNGAQLRLVDASGNNSNDINLGVDISLAGARGTLTSVSCSPDPFDADLWTDLLKAAVSGSAYSKGDVKTTVLGIPLVSVPVSFKIAVNASASQNATPAGSPAHGQIAIPPKTYDDHTEVGAGALQMPQTTVTIDGAITVGPVTLLGAPVPTATLLNAVTPIITPLVTGLAGTGRIGSVVNPLVNKLNTVLSQLSTGLGINVAGADLYGLPTPNCQTPVLRG
jgi:uncharacterized membrane protein